MIHNKGIKIIITGIMVQAVGLVMDVLHHLSIGIKTPEGLITIQHFIIGIGFLINCVGVLILLLALKQRE